MTLAHRPHCLRHRPLPGPGRGFTLIELLVVIAIVGILVAAAVPSFTSALAGANLNEQAAALSRAINLARSEAVKRGRPVAVCRSDNPEQAPPSCDGNGGNWVSGWIVFVDDNASNTLDGNDFIVKVQPGFANGGTITTNQPQNALRFNGQGLGVGMQQTFTFAPASSGSTRNRTLTLNSTGRWTSAVQAQ